MPKYRRLTEEELLALEKEFIEFLVANGIAAEDWVKIKQTDLDVVDTMVDLFSDVIMEGVLRKTIYLEKYFEKKVVTFFCDEEEITMLLMSSDALDADFTDPSYLSYASANPPADLEVRRQTKRYVNSRSEEIWDLIKQGCLVSDGKLHKALLSVYR